MVLIKKPDNGALFRDLRRPSDESICTTLEKLIPLADENEQHRLINEFGTELDRGYGLGWRMLAHYGAESVQLRLMRENGDKLDEKAVYPGEGWLLLSVYGTDAVRMELIRNHGDKLNLENGSGWRNIKRNCSEAVGAELGLVRGSERR